MRKAYYVACGLVYEIAFLATLAVVWRTESVFAAIVVAVPTGFLLSRCVTRTPAFRPVKDSLLFAHSGSDAPDGESAAVHRAPVRCGDSGIRGALCC
ncbi:MAG: hypothetical protein ACLT14_05665 [Butyricicoccaceae bacterium]